MRKVQLLTFLLLSLLLAFVPFADAKDSSSKEVDDEAGGSTDTVGKGDAMIEENPDYVEPDSDDDSEDSSDDDEEELDFADADSAKATIETALALSKKQYKKYLKIAKKNRTKITISLAVFAFRQEIRKFLFHLVTHEIMDPKTGKLRVSPTSILKLMLFVDFMRRLQSGRSASQPSFQALAELGQSNPLMGILFSRVLRVPMFNPAFLPPISQHYTFERINERYVKDGMALHKAIHAKHDGFKWPTADRAITRAMMAGSQLSDIPSSNETVVVLDMTGLDTTVTKMEQIRDEVSFLLSQYRAAAMKEATDLNATVAEEETSPSPLEIVVLLESPGGSAADYGLAAQQLLRLRNEPGITLTICVDKVAASGGYMMACTASPGQLFAAPFAVVGSIGVIGQIVNINKLLEGWGFSPLVFRGGKDKAPLGLIGEITQEGKDKTQAMVDITHEAFQQHVADARPVLKKSMKKVGTGDIFIGKGALNAGLIDKITTSDEYISAKVAEGARVLKLLKNRKARFPFAANFDNYDTTLEGRHSLSLSNVLWGAWRSTASYLGFGSDDSVANSFRQAVSVVQSPNVQTS
jgi:signal peptide peptidase SppA